MRGHSEVTLPIRLTFDDEVDLIGGGVTLDVGDQAGVVARPLSTHSLQHWNQEVVISEWLAPPSLPILLCSNETRR